MGKRRYKSELRDAQAEQTRQKLLDALHALLLEMAVEDVSIPKVAARAGVSAPTAYRYFPTLDHLFRAFLELVRPRLGLAPDQLRALTPRATPEATVANYKRYERFGKLMRRLMDSPTWQRVRQGDGYDRAGLIQDDFARHAPGLDPRDLRVATGAIMLFLSPPAWRWLRDLWGLSAADATRAARFATSALIDALEGRTSIDPQPGEPS